VSESYATANCIWCDWPSLLAIAAARGKSVAGHATVDQIHDVGELRFFQMPRGD